MGAAILPAFCLVAVTTGNYSEGERTGQLQKFSSNGWLCKTWEGELSIVSAPGSTPEKFSFTVWNDAVAEQLAGAMGQRLNLRYEQKIGIPTCFGETRYYVTDMAIVPEIPVRPPN